MFNQASRVQICLYSSYSQTAPVCSKSIQIVTERIACAAFRRVPKRSLSTLSTSKCQLRAHYSSSSHRGVPKRNYSEAYKHKTRLNEVVPILQSASSIRSFFWSTFTVVALGFGYVYVTDTRASIHEYVSVPLVRYLFPDAEDSHHAGVKVLKVLYQIGLHPRERDSGNDTSTSSNDATTNLETDIFGHTLSNPIGISAGLDKHGEIPSALLALGPGIVEIGGVTPEPQPGNPRPRVWRIPSQEAIINRYGLNSVGADAVAQELRMRVRHFANARGLGTDADAERIVLSGAAGVPPGSLAPGKLLAIQIAKQSSTSPHDLEAVVRDYETCALKLAPYADVLVLNVSSPNTPGLRSLQDEQPLTRILTGVISTAERAVSSTPGRKRPAVMVKVSPDEDSDAHVEAVCKSVARTNAQGVIVANTTTSRPAVSTIPVSLPSPSPSSTSSMSSTSVTTPSSASVPASTTNTTPYNATIASAGLPLSSNNETNALSQAGGYSGPLTFPRTVSLVQRYRAALDKATSSASPSSSSSTPLSTSSSSSSPPPPPPPQPPSSQTPTTNITNPPSPNLPQKPPSPSPSPSSASSPSPSPSTTKSSKPQPAPQARKVIFASGGIKTGAQARQVLDAGADVAMLYTTMTYGGVGCVTRIKGELGAGGG